MTIQTSTTNDHEMVYDYIVCGAGAAGCAVAARLAEDPYVTVLLVEAGQHNEFLENTKMVGGWLNNTDNPTDWNIITEPSPGINDRTVKVHRGRFLGGSTGLNGTLCVRGTRTDYDSWGLEGWSGEDMWKYMSKAETFHPKDWFQHDAKSHGFSGPVHTEPQDAAPITDLIMNSFVSHGIPYHSDMFTTGNQSHGCSHVNRTLHKGIRSTAADYLLGKGENLVLLTDTTVDKVNLTKNNNIDIPQEWIASSIDVITKNGSKKTLSAEKEIIISGGAYCSPTILLRSGIGPKEEIEAVGIESKVDLPGVGKNLMDHVICFIFYESTNPSLTTNRLLYPPGAFENSYNLWKASQSGVLATFPFGAFAYTRFDDTLKDEPLWASSTKEDSKDPMGLEKTQPNAEFFTLECYGGPKQFAHFPVEGNRVFGILPMLCGPRSRGSVTITSSDASEKPVVQHNYLADELDLLVLAEACRAANEIVMQGKGTKDIVKGSWPPDQNHHEYKTRQEWIPFVKENATTCYHPSGTCKMGVKDDPMAVLDERLRVRGVAGLRVADVSVMPTVNNGHTQMPAYGIGEKCAWMVSEDNSRWC